MRYCQCYLPYSLRAPTFGQHMKYYTDWRMRWYCQCVIITKKTKPKRRERRKLLLVKAYYNVRYYLCIVVGRCEAIVQNPDYISSTNFFPTSFHQIYTKICEFLKNLYLGVYFKLQVLSLIYKINTHIKWCQKLDCMKDCKDKLCINYRVS